LLRWLVAKPLSGKAVFALWSVPVDDFLRTIGFAVCHQFPGHTLSCQGIMMPLCARCTGIYSGLFFTVLILLALGRLQRTRLPSAPGIAFGLGFFAAMAADVFTALLGWRETSNVFRLTTGALVGTAIPVLGLPLANGIVWGRETKAKILSLGEFLLISLAVLGLSFLSLIHNLLLFRVVSLVSIIGLLLFMLGMNSLPLAGLHGGGRKQWLIVPGALVLTVGELVLLSSLHRGLLRMPGLE
jgi:uncharacterized membrane protein